MEYVYALSDGKNIKIGISKNPKRRIKQLNTGNSAVLYLLGYFEGDRALEHYIHTHFKRIRLNGEWLEPNDDLLDYLNLKLEDLHICFLDGKLRSFKKIKK